MHNLLRNALLIALAVVVVAASAHAQFLDPLNRPQITPDMPEWAALLYEEPVNVPRVDSAFAAYYRNHEFKKNNYTKCYRRWRHAIEPYLQPDGSILRGTPDEMEARFRPRKAATRMLGAANVWMPMSMNTFSPGAASPIPWQVNVYSFAVSRSNPNILVCATEPGGIFRSTDKGMSWVQIGREYDLASEALAIHPSDPNTIYLGANGAIRKSTDAGATWKTVFTRDRLWCYRMEVLASQPSVVVAAANDGLYRTTDAGATWTRVLTTVTCELAVHPTRPSTIYALQGNGANRRYELWKSTDYGATFTLRSTGWYSDTSDGGGRMTVTPADPKRIYVVLLGPKGPRILRSNDEGETWSVTAAGNSDSLKMNNGQGYYDLSIVASATNADHLIAASTTAYKSTDGGRHFTEVGGYIGPFPIHPDIQDMKAVGGDTWIATDGGMTLSSDFFTDTRNADARVSGLYASDFWGFDLGHNDDVMVGGRYHNGNTAITDGFGGKFMRLGGGEAATGYVNPIRPHRVYFSDIGGYVLPDSFTNTLTRLPVGRWPNESYFQMWYSGMTWDPRCYGTVWIGSGNTLYRSENNGASYDSIFAVRDSTALIGHIEIARSNPDVIYITEHNTTVRDARVWRSSNGGATWDSLSRFPGTTGNERRQMKITLSGTDENELWAALALGSSTSKVFHTTDGGRSWTNLTTPTIKDISVSDVLHQLGTDGGVYLAGSGGQLFYRNNTMSDWQPYNSGLWIGNYVRRLKPFYRDGTLRAGTNLGIWEVPLFEPGKPLAQPTVDKRVTECPRDTFYFGDYSALRYDQERWQWEFPGAAYVSSRTDRDPKVVYGTPGVYSVTLTVTNSAGTSSRTIADMVEVRPSECGIGSIAGRALDLGSTSDVATIAPLPGLAGASSVTLSAWVKPASIQRSFSQILSNWSSDVGFSFGFAFMGYRANTNLTFYWRDSVPYQLTTPFNLDTLVWTHVAITVEPDRVTLYRNGEPWVYRGNFSRFDLSSTPFELGGGLPGQGGNFQGEIDEVKFYNRALSTREIREGMHLIHPEGEPGLVGYYQFNEASRNRLYDGIGALHADNGGGEHVRSTIPAAVGASARIDVADAGEKDFSGTGVKIRYGNAGSLPNGEVVAYHLMASPDTLPAGMTQLTPSYWIVRNWGGAGSSTDTLIFTGIGRVSAADSADVGRYFSLFERGANEHRARWELLTNRALQPFAPETGTLWFEFANGSLPYGQFIIGTTGSSVLGAPDIAVGTASPGFSVTPNPTGGLVTIRFMRNGSTGALQLSVSDILGQVLERREIEATGVGEQSIRVDLSAYPAGPYIIRIDGGSVMVIKQ
jgi:photosystem II stability/assembly factor-like uncharacterized protein/PKD repeat protein